jgi:hypothetical protein
LTQAAEGRLGDDLRRTLGAQYGAHLRFDQAGRNAKLLLFSAARFHLHAIRDRIIGMRNHHVAFL